MVERYEIAWRIIENHSVKLRKFGHIRRYVFFHANSQESLGKFLEKLLNPYEFPHIQELLGQIDVEWIDLHMTCLKFIESVLDAPHVRGRILVFRALDEYVNTLNQSSALIEKRSILRVVK